MLSCPVRYRLATNESGLIIVHPPVSLVTTSVLSSSAGVIGFGLNLYAPYLSYVFLLVMVNQAGSQVMGFPVGPSGRSHMVPLSSSVAQFRRSSTITPLLIIDM